MKEGLTAVSAEIGSETNESLSPVPRLPSSLNNERAASETQEREEGVRWGVIGGKEVACELDSLICFYRSDIWLFRPVLREATLEDVANVKRRMVLMKADLLAEVVTVRYCFILTIVHCLFASPSITFYAHLSDLTVAY